MRKLILAIALACPVVAAFTVRAQTPDPNHTVVRFNVLTGGMPFGHLDIELFDQEKPETVRNFLLYVHTGGYSNLVLHELAHDGTISILQAGRVLITNTTSSDAFTSYVPAQSYGAITNEYGVGPEFHNDYGTISMARVAGVTNSASTDFFFNLSNNPSLDTREGGFTVFGRVVNTTDERSGTNLLNYFNSRTPGNGIGNVFIYHGGFNFESFDVAVSTNRPSGVTYADLFTVNASVIQGGIAFGRESVAPSVAISDPAGNIRTEGANVPFSGTAGDNTQVARVFYDSPLGRFAVTGRENWNAQVGLLPGTNQISVRSMDWFGNMSPAVTRTIFYSVPRPVALQIQGKGKVTGITNGQTLEVGVTYKLVARPSPGQYFNGWRGGTFSNDRTYYFTMREGTTNIIAVFTKTLLDLTRGTYSGVFFPETNGPPQSSGFLTLNLSGSGLYGGHLMPLGANYPIRGKFDAQGNSVIAGRRGVDILILQLRLFPLSDIIAGSYTDGHFISFFTLWLAPKFDATNPAPAGNYSFVITPPRDPNVAVNEGFGSGAATIDSLGRIKMSGLLGNGTAIHQNAALLKQNQWAFFASANAGREAALGWVTFGSNNVLNANLRWFSRSFPGGTNQNAEMNGSLYTPPSQARLFNWTDGTLTISGDGLPQAIDASIVLNEDGSFTVPSNPNNVQLGFPDAKGTITGSFTHPVTMAITPLRGAVSQASNMAAGLFTSGTNSGAFVIRAP